MPFPVPRATPDVVLPPPWAPLSGRISAASLTPFLPSRVSPNRVRAALHGAQHQRTCIWYALGSAAEHAHVQAHVADDVIQVVLLLVLLLLHTLHLCFKAAAPARTSLAAPARVPLAVAAAATDVIPAVPERGPASLVDAGVQLQAVLVATLQRHLQLLHALPPVAAMLLPAWIRIRIRAEVQADLGTQGHVLSTRAPRRTAPSGLGALQALAPPATSPWRFMRVVWPAALVVEAVAVHFMRRGALVPGLRALPAAEPLLTLAAEVRSLLRPSLLLLLVVHLLLLLSPTLLVLHLLRLLPHRPGGILTVAVAVALVAAAAVGAVR